MILGRAEDMDARDCAPFLLPLVIHFFRVYSGVFGKYLCNARICRPASRLSPGFLCVIDRICGDTEDRFTGLCTMKCAA